MAPPNAVKPLCFWLAGPVSHAVVGREIPGLMIEVIKTFRKNLQFSGNCRRLVELFPFDLQSL